MTKQANKQKENKYSLQTINTNPIDLRTVEQY